MKPAVAGALVLGQDSYMWGQAVPMWEMGWRTRAKEDEQSASTSSTKSNLGLSRRVRN